MAQVETGIDADPVLFNPFEPGFFDAPYDQYRQLRLHDPVHHSPIDTWMLFAYEDCFALLRDPAMSVDPMVADRLNPGAPNRFEAFRERHPELPEPTPNRGILNIDPPDHTRIRRLMSKVFTPRRIEQLRPAIQARVDAMIDAVAGDGGMDVITDLAFPLPFVVISEMLGMPAADRDLLRDWSHAVVKLLDPVVTDDEVLAAAESSAHMLRHCREAIEWKRANPADDLLTALIHAEDEGHTLTSDELVDQLVLLFIAGHETTVNLIGNATLALLRHPGQLRLLRDDPSLDANAVDELLRYDSPVQFSRRIVLQPYEVGGVVIEPGTFLMTCLGSANHDTTVFGPDAAELDLTRPNASRHLSFGSGVHHCLGAALARLEAQVALGTLVRRLPGLALVDDAPAWNERIVLRGLDALPVTF